MRGRPKIALYLRPATAVADGEVTAELVLNSKGETPVDFISLTLRGEEWIRGEAGWDKRAVVAQQAKFPARTLEPGEQRVAARFVLPPDAPPTHRGTAIYVRYELDAHVSIPWWPDRRELYVLPVVRRALPSLAEPPKVFTNARSSPADLHLEATLDRLSIEAGGVVAGVVSFANVAGKRLDSVELVFRAREGVTTSRGTYWIDGASLVSSILDRPPREGESAAFRVRLPADATATFANARARLAWSVAVVVHVSFGEDVRLEVPITVTPAHQQGAGLARRQSVLPPVGRERRALLFRAVGQRLGLEVDPEGEELRGAVGAATLLLRLEQREDEGLMAVAELSWPALALDLAVRERRWSDAFGDGVELGDPAFEKRVHVRASDVERARRLFDEALRAAMLDLPSLELHDEGALLGRPVRVQSTEAMLEDVLPLFAAAEALGAAVARVAPTTTAYR